MPTLEEISDAGVTAHEIFVRDMNDMDWYWANGRLAEWVAKQIEEVKRDAGDSGSNT